MGKVPAILYSSMADIRVIPELVPPFEDIAQRNISVTLADFKFTSDPNEAFSLSMFTGMNRDDDTESVGESAPAYGNGDEEDFFGGGNDYNDQDQDGGDYAGFFGGDAPQDLEGDVQDGVNGDLHTSANANSRVVYGPTVPFDPTKSTGSNGLVMAMDDGEAMMLDYFDQGFLKNWAGPEHWKLRRAIKRGKCRSPVPMLLILSEILFCTVIVEPAENATTAKQARKEKTPFLIDFENADPPSAKDLFATAKAAITLPASATKKRRGTSPPKGRKGKKSKEVNEEIEERDEHLLPDDMHFSSRQLLRLFMKPKFTVSGVCYRYLLVR